MAQCTVFVQIKKIGLSHITIILKAMSHVNKLNIVCRIKGKAV